MIFKNYMKQLFLFGTFFLMHTIVQSAQVSGTLSTWYKVQIDFEGPELNELSTKNPFTDYRMDVQFTGPEGQTYKVPGYFAADGASGETSAELGNVWRVNFCPDAPGEWNFETNFVTGKNIAANLKGGESAAFFDGETGSFTVVENTDTDPLDFRNKGKLVYVDDHFLQFSGSKEYFIKAGANSPEVFLEYAEFDNTETSRVYPDHISDWNNEDPTWKDEQGKGIIGAVNYLSEIGVNAHYFLTMNAYGDGKKSFPFIHKDSMYRYDCSKLDQWDIVFNHMNKKGIMVHFVMTETENESYFEVNELGEPGGFAASRKIYYREMIARYGYLPAVTWNIGEENGWADDNGNEPYKVANTNQQRKDFCSYVRELTYYKDHISIHNGPSTDDYIYDDLIGHESHTGPAFQWNFSTNIYEKMLEWRNRSIESGHKWVMFMDEVYINPAKGDFEEWRTKNVWPTFMAGGAGIELYIGSGLDLKVENYREYEDQFKTMVYAADFIRNYIPAQQMEPQTISDKWALTKGDDIFAFYLTNAENVSVDLPSYKYKVLWYNTQKGGAPVFGSLHTVNGGNATNLGTPPSAAEADWVCLLTKTDDEQSFLDIDNSIFNTIIEEGNTEDVKPNTITITAPDNVENLSGSANVNWITVDKNTDNPKLFSLTLNNEANKLTIGSYTSIVTFTADGAEPVYLNYSLHVNFNLEGLEYFYLDNNMAIIEVESTPMKDSWSIENQLDGYSGDGYYFYNNELNQTPGIEELTNKYIFYVPTSTEYQVLIRNYNDDENNSSWVKMDDDNWMKHVSNIDEQWNWETQTDDGSNNLSELKWQLNEGFHTFQICAGSPNFFLDKIHIINSKAKDYEYQDSSWIESPTSDHNIPIITLSRNMYYYSKTEGNVNITTKNITIGNAGIGTLNNITATSSSDWAEVSVSGAGNDQKLTIEFNENTKNLTTGSHSCSIVLSEANASDREVKIYIDVKRKTGKVFYNIDDIRLKSNVVNHELQLLGTIDSNLKLKVFDTSGRLVFHTNSNNLNQQKIEINNLSKGTYILNIKSQYGVCNKRFIKI